ncbi:molybdopterin-guanine dinucleotide biosynthesis protein B [Lysinibacillus sp. BF-4]|nr:molybdopterin-guanine dinucleotide biosynthesis protein B [Lysinibacillus sp. BF-4]
MAVGQHQKILQVVGYQNSGKTTITRQLIADATASGLRIGSIKHHGHGGKPDAPSNKDSTLHEQAGAVVSAVEGGGALRLSIEDNSWELTKILTLYQSFALDFILIEGYKQAPYPKIVLLRSDKDAALLTLSNIHCILYWEGTTIHQQLNVPSFSLAEHAQYQPFLLQEMRNLL